MAEITTHNNRTWSNSRYIWPLFVTLVIFTYFFGLTIPLVGPDEPRYAQVAREMFERHDWVTPTLGGFHWFEKPALLYWLEIVSYKFLGVTEFAARLGPALFGLGTVLSLWILGRSITTESTEVTEKDRVAEPSKISSKIPVPSVPKDFANWLALIAASTIGIIVFARGASFDIILTFPITASLVGFFIFDRSDESSTRLRLYASLFAFYFFIGVSLLAKGLVGIVFPFAIVAFYYVLSWKFPPRQFILSLFWGTFLSLAIAAVWYLPMYERHGYEFIDEFIIQQHFQRFTSNKYQHPQPFYFFFWVLPLMTIPWLPFFVAGLWTFVKGIFKRRDAETQSEESSSFTVPLRLFAIAWLAVPLVFFSLSGSKLPGYILPSVPAAVIIAGEFISRFVSKRPGWRMPLVGVAFTTLIAVCLLSQFVVPEFAEKDSVKSLIGAANVSSHASEKIFSLHTISHNAEFYGANRIVRTDDGKQRRFNGFPEAIEEMRRESLSEALLLMPKAYTRELSLYDSIDSSVLAQNDELAIVAIRLK